MWHFNRRKGSVPGNNFIIQAPLDVAVEKNCPANKVSRVKDEYFRGGVTLRVETSEDSVTLFTLMQSMRINIKWSFHSTSHGLYSDAKHISSDVNKHGLIAVKEIFETNFSATTKA